MLRKFSISISFENNSQPQDFLSLQVCSLQYWLLTQRKQFSSVSIKRNVRSIFFSPVLEALFNKDRLKACKFIKKRLKYRCFSVKIMKFLRTPIVKNICERLFLCWTQHPTVTTYLITTYGNYLLAQIAMVKILKLSQFSLLKFNFSR